MKLFVIISGIVTIAIFISIFYKVNPPKTMPYKKFIRILFIICILVFCIDSLGNKLSERVIKGIDKRNSSDSVASSGDFGSETESEERYVEPTDEKPADEEKEKNSDKEILKIDSITYNTYNAGAIEDSPFEIQPNDIIGISGEISN